VEGAKQVGLEFAQDGREARLGFCDRLDELLYRDRLLVAHGLLPGGGYAYWDCSAERQRPPCARLTLRQFAHRMDGICFA
jgi:hypothetical protein